MVLLTPPAIVNTVIVIAGRGNGNFVKVGIDQHRSRAHKSSTRMSIDPYPIDINKRIAIGQLLHHSLSVGQSIIAEVTISIIMIPFAPARYTTTVAGSNYNKT